MKLNITAMIGTFLMATAVVANPGPQPCLACKPKEKDMTMCKTNHMTYWIQKCDGTCWQTVKDCTRNEKCDDKPEPHCYKA